MVTKAISIPMAEHMNQTSLYLQSKVIVLQILSDESCNLATQLGSRKLVEKFILGGFNYLVTLFTAFFMGTQVN